MKTVKNFSIMFFMTMLLATNVSCGNPIDKHLSLEQHFVDKWEDKAKEKFSDDDLKDLQNEYKEIEASEQQLYKEMQENPKLFLDVDQERKESALSKRIYDIKDRAENGGLSSDERLQQKLDDWQNQLNNIGN